MILPAQFDVFLCHNSEDKLFIRDIARQLRAQNLTPWLDEEQLIPGRDWLDILEQDIAAIKTVGSVLDVLLSSVESLPGQSSSSSSNISETLPARGKCQISNPGSFVRFRARMSRKVS